MISRVLLGWGWVFIVDFLACLVTGGVGTGLAVRREPRNPAGAQAEVADRDPGTGAIKPKPGDFAGGPVLIPVASLSTGSPTGVFRPEVD